MESNEQSLHFFTADNTYLSGYVPLRSALTLAIRPLNLLHRGGSHLLGAVLYIIALMFLTVRGSDFSFGQSSLLSLWSVNWYQTVLTSDIRIGYTLDSLSKLVI